MMIPAARCKPPCRHTLILAASFAAKHFVARRGRTALRKQSRFAERREARVLPSRQCGHRSRDTTAMGSGSLRVEIERMTAPATVSTRYTRW